MSDFLYGKGYFGRFGIDVVEDGQREQYVVDLNVRTVSSSLLGSPRGHFVSQDMNHAGLVFIRFEMRRRQIGEERWKLDGL